MARKTRATSRVTPLKFGGSSRTWADRFIWLSDIRTDDLLQAVGLLVSLQRITLIRSRGGRAKANHPWPPRASTRHDFSKTAPVVRQRKIFGCHWLRQCFPGDITVWTYTGKASGTQPESQPLKEHWIRRSAPTQATQTTTTANRQSSRNQEILLTGFPPNLRICTAEWKTASTSRVASTRCAGSHRCGSTRFQRAYRSDMSSRNGLHHRRPYAR